MMAHQAFSDYPSNSTIRSQVDRVFSEFVSAVDPGGVIMDHLIQYKVFSYDRKERIMSERTKSDRCRALLMELSTSQNPIAFQVLLMALKNDDGYPWIAIKIEDMARESAVSGTLSKKSHSLEELSNEQPTTTNQPRTEIVYLHNISSEDETTLHSAVQDDDVTILNAREAPEMEDTPKNELDSATKKFKWLRTAVIGLAVLVAVLLGTIVFIRSRNGNLEMTNSTTNWQTNFITSSQKYSRWEYSKPILYHTLLRGNYTQGVTVLFDEVFLIGMKNPEVEVYASINWTQRRSLFVPELLWANDIVSSVKYNCLYISDEGNINNTCRIHRIELGLKGNIRFTNWKVNCIPLGLSITIDGNNMIVTCIETLRPRLLEYTMLGDFVREICLPYDLINPFHAIQLFSGVFVVSHGDTTDPVSRICLIDVDGQQGQTSVTGQVRQCYDGTDKQQLNVPEHMGIDTHGNILIADSFSHRILISSSSLNEVTELVASHEFEAELYPHRLYIQESLLYIAVNEYKDNSMRNSEVRIYKVKNN